MENGKHRKSSRIPVRGLPTFRHSSFVEAHNDLARRCGACVSNISLEQEYRSWAQDTHIHPLMLESPCLDAVETASRHWSYED